MEDNEQEALATTRLAVCQYMLGPLSMKAHLYLRLRGLRRCSVCQGGPRTWRLWLKCIEHGDNRRRSGDSKRDVRVIVAALELPVSKATCIT